MKSKRFLAVCIAMCCMFASTGMASAAEVHETEAERRERVFEEVLTGNITSDEDVIAVALEQYEAKKQRALLSDEKVEDDYLSITQVVGERVNENGVPVEDIVSTGLMIVDENMRRIPVDQIVSGSGQLSQYSIYATMKVSLVNDTQESTAKLKYIETTLNYGTQMKAGSLEQFFWYSSDYIGDTVDVKKKTSNPKANFPYRYYPTYTGEVFWLNINCHFSAVSVIKAGTSTLNMKYMISKWNPQGAWYNVL